MKVIVGLGNPGKKYDNTRHNIGFEALDYIADKEGISINTGKHKALIGTGYMGGEKVLLVKPQTFMNLSGESLRPIMDFYKLEPEDFIIIHDDIDLDEAAERISRVFGIAAFSRACECEKDFDDIKIKTCEYLFDELSEAKTFKVEAKRSDKKFPMKSPEISRELGGYILSKFNNFFFF